MLLKTFKTKINVLLINLYFLKKIIKFKIYIILIKKT